MSFKAKAVATFILSIRVMHLNSCYCFYDNSCMFFDNSTKVIRGDFFVPFVRFQHVICNSKSRFVVRGQIIHMYEAFSSTYKYSMFKAP